MSHSRTPLEIQLNRNSREQGECLIYGGYVDKQTGVGFVYVGHAQRAHRAAFELYHGRKVRTNMIIVQTCGNKLCIRKEHLAEITQAEGMRRSRACYRNWEWARGEKNARAKITSNIALMIRDLASKEGWTTRRLAEEFKVSHQCVSDILQRKSWAHV